MRHSLSENCIVRHEDCTVALDSTDLAARIDLSFLDPPFNVVAEQLGRKSVGIELDSHNVILIENRLAEQRKSDDVSRFFKDYIFTPDLEAIWGEFGQNKKVASAAELTAKQLALLESKQ